MTSVVQCALGSISIALLMYIALIVMKEKTSNETVQNALKYNPVYATVIGSVLFFLACRMRAKKE